MTRNSIEYLLYLMIKGVFFKIFHLSIRVQSHVFMCNSLIHIAALIRLSWLRFLLQIFLLS